MLNAEEMDGDKQETSHYSLSTKHLQKGKACGVLILARGTKQLLCTFETLSWSTLRGCYWGKLPDRLDPLQFSYPSNWATVDAISSIWIHSTAPVFQQPNSSKHFVVKVDASKVGVGVVLSQHAADGWLHLCAFFSQELSPAECNYDTGNHEMLAIMITLEKWRHWLEGNVHPFQVLTNHRNLEYLRMAKCLNPWQTRSPVLLTQFGFKFNSIQFYLDSAFKNSHCHKPLYI